MKNNDMTIIDKKDNICDEHDFGSLPFVIRNEPENGIYREVAYVVCKKCGQIRRQNLPLNEQNTILGL